MQKPDGDVPCPHCNGTGRIAPQSMTIGTRFLRHRLKLERSQEQLAPLLKVSRAQLANIEGDRGRPGLETLVHAADVFGCSVDFLLGRTA